MEILIRIGRPICEAWTYFCDLSALAGRFLFPFFSTSSRGRKVVRRTTLMQIYFTGVQGVPVVALLGALLGVALASVIPQQELLVTFMVKGYIPELSALLASLAILARSTTAITVELGNMTVNGEMRLLRSMGIDPNFHVIVPRVIGVLVAAVGLSVIAATSAPLAAAAVLGVTTQMAPIAFLADIVDNLSLHAGLSVLLKSLLFGGILVFTALREGLHLLPYSTEVPKSVSKSVMRALMLLFSLEVLLLVLAYDA